METQDKWKLVSFGNISHCDFCNQPPVEYLMISSQEGVVQVPPIFLCGDHRKIVIHNVILHQQVTAADLEKGE